MIKLFLVFNALNFLMYAIVFPIIFIFTGVIWVFIGATNPIVAIILNIIYLILSLFLSAKLTKLIIKYPVKDVIPALMITLFFGICVVLIKLYALVNDPSAFLDRGENIQTFIIALGTLVAYLLVSFYFLKKNSNETS